MSSTTPETTNVAETNATVPETTTSTTPEVTNAPAPAAAAAAAAAPEDDEDDNECETVSENIHQRVITTELGEMTELESMCPCCEDNGITRLMITNIPHFRQVIVSSFNCEHCGERNTEIQFGGTFGAKRTRHELKVQKQEDMNRQVVKSEYATLCIPELELELPRETQTGSLNTVEGILVKTIEGLQAQQALRRIQHPEVAQQIDEYCTRLESYRDGSKKFTITIDDPSGNSHIEPYYDYYHPTIDPQLSRQEFVRSDEERQLLGLAVEGAAAAAADEEDLGLPAPPATSSITHPAPAMTPAKKAEIAKAAAALLHGAEYNKGRTDAEEQNVDEGILDNVFEMAELCPACRAPQVLKMHKVDIPHFKSTIIMAFKCDVCGYKSTEIKSGGEISSRGKRITLRVENDEDMKRDLLKSNTAALSIPELDLELVPGTLGGFFTTVEGLLSQIHTNLKSTPTTDFARGDSAAVNPRYSANSNRELQTSMKSFLDKLQDTIDGKSYPFTLILDDPLADIYIQNSRAHLPPPENVDPQLTIEDYVRTEEQDDELGLLDMDVDQKEEQQ